MRKLKTSDLFAMARCLKAIGLKDEIKKIAMEANKVEDIAAKGFDYFYILFEKAVDKKSEKPIYEFLSNPFEMTAQEVENLELTELFKGISEVADIATWKAFFKTAVH